MNTAELKAVLNAEPPFLDRLTRDVSTIGGTEIFEEDAVAGIFDAGMALGDRRIVDNDVVNSGASDIGDTRANGESFDFCAEGDAQVRIGGREADRFGGAVVVVGDLFVPDSCGFAENLHVRNVDRLTLSFFTDDKFGLGIA